MPLGVDLLAEVRQTRMWYSTCSAALHFGTGVVGVCMTTLNVDYAILTQITA